MAIDQILLSICQNPAKQGEIFRTQRRFDITFTKTGYFRIIGMTTGAMEATIGAYVHARCTRANYMVPPRVVGKVSEISNAVDAARVEASDPFLETAVDDQLRHEAGCRIGELTDTADSEIDQLL